MPLSLTRRSGEEIRIRFPQGLSAEELQEIMQIGISVAVLGVNGNQTKLCIRAPRSVSILRAELLKQ